MEATNYEDQSMNERRSSSLLTLLALLAVAAPSASGAPLCIDAPGKICPGSANSRGGVVRVTPVPGEQTFSCTTPGIWQTLYGEVTVNSDLTGTLVLPYCPEPLAVTITPTGSATFSVRNVWSGDLQVCQSSTENMTFTSAGCDTATGSFVNDDGSSGPDTWTRTGCQPVTNGVSCQAQLTLSRSDLLTVVATGTPDEGTFSYNSTPDVEGDTVATIAPAAGVTPQTNPNTAILADPANPDPHLAPYPGGLLDVTATYSISAGNQASKSFAVPTFGLSCYYTALETDWGTPPDKCSSLTIKGKRYSGTVVNPAGLSGTFCRSFIAEVELQGSGVTADHRSVQYNRSANTIGVVSNILASDGSSVVAGQTLARDRNIIPRGGVLVELDQIGQGLLANDTGGAIKNYRIDLYKGAGVAVCAKFANIMSVAACSPGNDLCPALAIN
jgi:3D (Asp-Asp-Asp) domain-containing protein